MAMQAERPQEGELIDEDQYGPQLVNKLEVQCYHFNLCEFNRKGEWPLRLRGAVLKKNIFRLGKKGLPNNSLLEQLLVQSPDRVTFPLAQSAL